MRNSITLIIVTVSTLFCLSISGTLYAETVAEKYKNQGNAYYKQKKYRKAIVAYTNAVMEDMDYAEAYYNRGLVFFDQGFFYKAIVDFDMALMLNPQDKLSYYSRGLAYSKVGKIALALNDIKKADKLGDYDARKLLQSGILTRRNEQRIKKDKAIEKLIGETATDYSRKVEITDRNNEYGGNTILTIHSKGDPYYDGKDGIFKDIEYFDSKDRKRRTELMHTAVFNKENGRNKTTIWYNESMQIEKKEYFYTGKMLNLKGVHFYNADGRIEKKVMFDKHGNEIVRR